LFITCADKKRPPKLFFQQNPSFFSDHFPENKIQDRESKKIKKFFFPTILTGKILLNNQEGGFGFEHSAASSNVFSGKKLFIILEILFNLIHSKELFSPLK